MLPMDGHGVGILQLFDVESKCPIALLPHELEADGVSSFV